ncbi:hypothetical protein BU26DRAFT_451698 [Trematosphaeria pertusa]|uniref:Carbohydrate-binding module family 1 protein n=1 Tax=Trematosphaeria pertusa TaxID=390896 RepID=A0A6A6IMI5_9PLEO|nr:uncharacterized protein BU26DRAFT_451698 [Trematosphaeria pertusa]KAF2251774.1 hypothetical protein BU26DRAFT_451698 [Trematosphaeria pertusa]
MKKTERLVSIFIALSTLLDVAAQQSCGGAYAQCGGLLYDGPTCCETGLVCAKQNDYYSQCLTPGTPGASSDPIISVTTTTVPPVTTVSTPYRTSTVFLSGAAAAAHTQAAYPSGAGGCSGQAMADGACCPVYCSTDLRSERCTSDCTGSCITPDPGMCKSGTIWGEVHSVAEEESWHYSRSTHYGITSAGACGFGLYGLCAKPKEVWVDTMLGDACDAFCKEYPPLCQDPAGNMTLRGNFAAPNGDYYTQFWNSLPGHERDNYLSCGECFEVIHTKPDGADYAFGESGYTDPIILEITDSCPCWPNPKWCCGSGADRCGEINFKYGCPLPKDSIHLDLSDIAMGRLQGNGNIVEGVIPTRYRRVQCPKPGNVYVWLHPSAGLYYFQVTAVNVASSTGSIVNMEVRGAGQREWVTLIQQPDYSSSRPQERYGAWQILKDSGPYKVPIGMRLTSATGEQIVNEALITSFTEPSTVPSGSWYLDMGLQFIH